MLDGFRATIGKLVVHSTAFGVEELTRTPLLPVGQSEWTPLWQTDFLRQAGETITHAREVRAAYTELATIAGLPPTARLGGVARGVLGELGRALPACAGTRWSFAARVDATEVFQELQAAIAVVAEHRSVAGGIDEPWPLQVIAACRKGIGLLPEREGLRKGLPSPWPPSIIAELERGIGLLERLPEEERQLSVRYDVSRLNASLLYGDWQKSEASIWPFSMLGKRRVSASLAAGVTSGGQPNAVSDLPVLVRMETIRAQIAAIDLRALPPGIWMGIQTSVEVAKSAIRLQTVLSAVRDGGPWEAKDFGLVEAGLCGPEMRHTLACLARLTAIDAEIGGLEWLQEATGGLWAGNATRLDALIAAADFCEDWRTGTMHYPHAAVASGDCGSVLRKQSELLRRREELERQIAGYAHLGVKTGGLWRGLDTDLIEANRAAAFGAVLERTLPTAFERAEDIAAARSGIERLCRAGTRQQIQHAADAFTLSFSRFAAALTGMTAKGVFTKDSTAAFQAMDVDDVGSVCENILTAGPRLQRWCSWVQAREEARANGVAGFVCAVEKRQIAPAELVRAFEVNYSRWWLDHVVSADEVLRTFASAEHEKCILDFRTVDDRYTVLTRDWIRAKLGAKAPTADSVAVNSEWGTLRHELTKKKRHLPLRELLARIPRVVTTLTPCLLMSPLSIAQYLAVSSATFDLVVFDEASQITVWDAIGAIARAKQVVMVGDPKQLPPTNFFNRADDEEGSSEEVPDDQESILDECIGASLPSVQLSWHYRSRHESLIAFSNRRYYEGRLVTFPSPVTDDRAVSFHYVKGVYEKGGARTNPGEARAVVQDIVKRLRSVDFSRTGYSIGVVTFNGEQQKLIEDLLDQERRNDPALESYFGQDRLEPVFVKNLESVQGDERDIMYFSVTYGPDLTGKVSMNFGPMNRDGGERRLNVAITRARRELRVFSTLHPEQIDLSRTQSTGVSELKHFLEFAERGPRAFSELVTRSTGACESPFEQYVAAALEARGWTVHTQVGASDFRIDLGVVHPDAPGIYIAGIECDGATYHRSATARDRDKLREQVLRDLGWTILRIWSTDWWIDQDTTLNRLDAQLRVHLEESRARRIVSAASERAAELADESDEPGLPEGLPNQLVGAADGGVYRRNQSQPVSDEVTGVDPSAFFEPSYDAELTRMITTIVEGEGPILDEVLSRRIARMHGWLRTGTRINDRVSGIASRTCKKTKEEPNGTFFWPQDVDIGQPIPFRPGLDRAITEICMPELVSLAQEVLSSGKSGEEAVMAMAKAIGLHRLRAGSRTRLEAAIRRSQSRSEAGSGPE
jgi:very-short-patch-repair endonuclease